MVSGPGTSSALGGARFVSLTTFRRNGAGVATPVWIAGFGEHLVVTRPTASGKVERLRRELRVPVVACGRFGAVARGAGPGEGVAEILAPTSSTGG